MQHKKTVTIVSQSLDKDTKMILKWEIFDQLKVDFVHLPTVYELFPLLSDHKFHSDYIAIDVEDFYKVNDTEIFDVIKTISTLLNCTVQRINPGKPLKRDTKLLGIVGFKTDPILIKEILSLLPCGVCLRLGGNITVDMVKEDTIRYLKNDFSIPDFVKNLLKSDKKNPHLSNNSEIHLTTRQHQILNLLSHRGSSNKVIAKTLNISESTVKLHVSAILKKYNVKNRTQLAVFHNSTTH